MSKWIEKVQVSRAIYDGLIAVRDSRRCQMFILPCVQAQAAIMGHHDTALWIADNPQLYDRGFYSGFEIEE